jgi:hypothetical protein
VQTQLVPAVSQLGVSPLQAEAQHVPPTQLPEVHSPPLAHDCPFAFFATQAPALQYSPAAQELALQTHLPPLQEGVLPEQALPHEPQLLFDASETQLPPQQPWPEPQASPQPLQWAAVPSVTHAPPQQDCGAVHSPPLPHLHSPEAHESARTGSHVRSQLPQCAVEEPVFAQVVPHRVWPDEQPVAQARPAPSVSAQTGATVVHRAPHAPQFSPVVRSVSQVDGSASQSPRSASQPTEQLPPAHSGAPPAAGQGRLQAPQCAGSVCRFTQAPSQQL